MSSGVAEWVISRAERCKQSRGMSHKGPVLDLIGVCWSLPGVGGSRLAGSRTPTSSRWMVAIRSITGVGGRAQMVMQFLGSNSGGSLSRTKPRRIESGDTVRVWERFAYFSALRLCLCSSYAVVRACEVGHCRSWAANGLFGMGGRTNDVIAPVEGERSVEVVMIAQSGNPGARKTSI